MIERIVRDISKQIYEDPKDILEKIEYFRELSRKGLHTLSDGELAQIKQEFTTFFNVIITVAAPAYPTRLFRLTNNKNLCGGRMQKLQKVSDLLGPPAGLSNLGRCNLAGESVFYSALDFKTAIWETQPEPGDYITVSEWKIKEGKELTMHSIFHPKETISNEQSLKAYQSYLDIQKQFDPKFAEFVDGILMFFCEEFMKPVAADKKADYLFSAIVSSRFLQAKPDENGFKVDAISYPSIKRDYGVTNLAISNDAILEKLDLESITLYTVGQANYDEASKTDDEFFKISGIEYRVKDFDFEKDEIIYNTAKELELVTALVDKHKLYNN